MIPASNNACSQEYRRGVDATLWKRYRRLRATEIAAATQVVPT